MWETAGQRWRGDPRSYGETAYCRGSPGASDGNVSPQGGRPGFDPWVGRIPRRRAWQPTPVFLPGGSHGQRSLVGYSSWGRKGSDMAERLSTTYLQRQGGLGRPPRDPTSQDGGGRASARRWGPRSPAFMLTGSCAEWVSPSVAHPPFMKDLSSSGMCRREEKTAQREPEGKQPQGRKLAKCLQVLTENECVCACVPCVCVCV